MPLSTKSTTGSDREPPKRLSRKEFARQFRHAAYLRAKEFRKTDPRQIAIKERFKEQQKEFQRDAYKKAKERNKAYRDGIKKASDEKAGKKKAARRNKLRAMVVKGSSFENKLKG